MIWIIIAPLLSLIAVETVAEVSGIALKTSLQMKYFVEQWLKDSHELWTKQTKIDMSLQHQVDFRKHTVEWLVRKMLTIGKHINLRCDWNSTIYCITDYTFNESQYDWQFFQNYLEGNDSAAEIINSLRYDIQASFGNIFRR